MLRSKQQFWRIILSRFLSTYSLLTTSLSSTHTAGGGVWGSVGRGRQVREARGTHKKMSKAENWEKQGHRERYSSLGE